MPTVRGDSMRGLAVFISDIRNCKSKEAEVRRINKELANIRSKFKGDKTLDGYQKKKYVCKLLFIFLLGHDIDFGHTEAVNLLCSNKYTEKQIGYLFISVLINESSNLMNLVIQRLKDDLACRNPVFINLALQCIANIGSREMAENFATEIPKFLVSGDTVDSVKQNAALCLLKLIRTAPDFVQFGEWTSRVIHLLNDQHMGVVTAAVSLIEVLIKRNPDEYKSCVSLAVSRLSRVVTSSYTDLQDYTYYFVPAPWLSVKLLRLLQNYPPPEDPTVRSRLTECLEAILNKTQEPPKSKKVQHSNAKNAVLYEAINLIIHMDCDSKLLVRACNQLGQFLQHRETNLRYLALESMCLLATSEFSHDAVRKHQETIINALKNERDVSVRQRAVDLLYAMCDRTNAQELVGEMLTYLETADYSIREEMVLKVAILSEKYATDYGWYVDTILNLIRIAGDYVSEEVWHRVIQIVINREDVQGYAAKTVFEALQAPACHENMVKVSAYILGEFGNLIAGDPRSSPKVQFELLHSKFYLCSLSTRQLILSTYMKFVNLFPEIKADIQAVFGHDSNLRNSDVEIQQRAVEYLTIARTANEDVLATVLEEMPPFPERESSLLSKLKEKKPVGDRMEQVYGLPRHHGNPATLPSTTASIPPSVSVNAGATAESVYALPSQFVQSVGAQRKQSEPTEADLLGLDQGTGTSQPAVSTFSMDFLVDILGSSNGTVTPPGTASMSHQQLSHTPTNGASKMPAPVEDNFSKLLCKNSGVLFENSFIQIGIKSEYRTNLGRLALYYGNKTPQALTQFHTEVLQPAGSELQDQQQLNIEVKPAPNTVDAGAQSVHFVNAECLGETFQVPTLTVTFMHAGTKETLCLRLPLTLNKFLQPADMDQTVFFQRWKTLTQPGQECQRIVKAKQAMDTESVRNKLLGFGISVLPGIDPSPLNFVGAGILHTTQQQYGVLLRLEPDMQSQVFIPHKKHTVGSNTALLFVDGHNSHLSFKVATLAKENDVIVHCFPPHSTHALQPLDVGFFGPFKKTWKGILRSWYRESLHQAIDKARVPNLLASLWKGVSHKNICSGFLGSGLHPLDVSKPLRRVIGEESSSQSSSSHGSPSKTLRASILSAIAPEVSQETRDLIGKSKQKRRRVHAAEGEVITEEAAINRLRAEKEHRDSKKVPS